MPELNDLVALTYHESLSERAEHIASLVIGYAALCVAFIALAIIIF